MLHTEHISILSRQEAETEITLYYNTPHLIISISDPCDKPADVGIPGVGYCEGILRLWFHDTDDPDDKVWITPSQDHARMIACFIRDHKEEIVSGKLHLIVHCLAGISRSAATGAAIAKHLFGNDDIFFKVLHPNMLLYKLVLEELRKHGI